MIESGTRKIQPAGACTPVVARWLRGTTAAAVVWLSAGCMSWTPGWEQMPVTEPSVTQSNLSELERRLDLAGTEPELRAVIASLESATVAPADSTARLTRLAEAHILYGAAHASSRGDKGMHYERGLQYAERAMATNAAFLERVERGESIVEASAALTRREGEAMLLWVTGVSYHFREVLSGPGRVLSSRRIMQTAGMLERLMEIAPELEHGAVPFSLAIYNIARPPWAGRDLERAEELLARAETLGPESMLIPWGRAKYLHSRTGDLDAFERDLRQVLDLDPRAASTPYSWNVYFQRDAEKMLEASR